jgi:hypothetical protein
LERCQLPRLELELLVLVGQLLDLGDEVGVIVFELVDLLLKLGELSFAAFVEVLEFCVLLVHELELVDAVGEVIDLGVLVFKSLLELVSAGAELVELL